MTAAASFKEEGQQQTTKKQTRRVFLSVLFFLPDVFFLCLHYKIEMVV